MAATTVKTTCPYCGVGCGVLVEVEDSQVVKLRGDPDHPANGGRLCSKGAALAESLDLDGRLLSPVLDGNTCDWDTALDSAASRLQQVIQQHGAEAVAFYVSGQLLTEDYYVANKLMKGYLGSANIDTNSRLCMASTVAGYKRAFGSDTVPCSYEDLERAKLIVLVGSNTAWCHPVLYQRMMANKKANPDLMVVVIDPRRTNTCDIADLHLPLKPGTDVNLFNGLLAYLADNDEIDQSFVNEHTEGAEAALAAARQDVPGLAVVADSCGLAVADVERFYRLFARTDRTVTVFSQGVNQSSSGSDKVNSIINCHLLTGRIGRPGMGPFSFTGQPNAMGGREVGGLANQLAAHMELSNPAHRSTVQQFWQSPVIASSEGLKAVELFQAVADGSIKAVWIMGTNPVVSMPDADKVRAALQQCELVIVSDCMAQTDTTACADILLPAQAWGEKDGTVTNSERCISRQRAFLQPPGEARADWWIVAELARRMGFADGFAYDSVASVFREHAALSGAGNDGSRDFDISVLADLAEGDYAELAPLQWPLASDGAGTARMFTDGRYYHDNGRARFIAVAGRPPVNPVNEQYPLILNSGRIRDQWHTMTRTGKVARLFGHYDEPFVEIHPADASEYGLEHGDLAQISSRWGNAVLRVQLTDSQQRGCLFVPMHWNRQFASQANIDAVVNPVTDPVSGEPEFKHTPVTICRYQADWYGLLLSRRRLVHNHAGYWASAMGDGFWRYYLAGETAVADWSQAARHLLCCEGDAINWQELSDAGRGVYRAARFQGDRMESCLFVGKDKQLPVHDWVQGLLQQESVTEQERRWILTGQPPGQMEDQGRIVCACFGVGEKMIQKAIIEQRITTLEQLGDMLNAGTNCGSCRPELQALLDACCNKQVAN